MKKVLIVLLAVFMCLGFAACSSTEQKTDEASTDTERVGILTRNKVSAEEMNEKADATRDTRKGEWENLTDEEKEAKKKEIEAQMTDEEKAEMEKKREEREKNGEADKKPFRMKMYDFENLTDLEMALTSDKIDVARIGESTGKYMVAKNDKLTAAPTDVKAKYEYGMLLKKDDQELCDRISAAITKLNDNGTLAELQTKYIDGVIAGAEPEAIEMPTFNGADTIKVAVTGDLPPMDYVTADGKAAGFNVALLKAIAEELKVNIELVQVSAGARAVSLSSGKADVVFWTLSEKNEREDLDAFTAGDDQPDSTIQTVPYYSDSRMHVTLK